MPVVTRLKGKEALRDERIPLNKVSYSTFVKFSTQPVLFRVGYLNRDIIESSTGVSAIMGRAFHEGLQVFYGGSDEFIVSSKAEAIEYGLKAAVQYLEEYNDGFINYSKTVPTKTKAIEKVVAAFNWYILDSGTVWKPEQVLLCENKLEHTINVKWNRQQLNLPIPLNGRIDRVEMRDGKVIIFDPKMVYAFSNPDKIDGQKMIQAVQYYLLVYAELGVEPYSVIFEETKYTKNADGSDQIKRYEIVIKDNPLFFDFYFRLYEDLTDALLGKMVYVPNIHALYDGDVAMIAYIHRLDQPEELAKQMKKHKVDNVTDLLKRKIAKAGYHKKLMEKLEAQFEEIKSIDYNKMQNHEKIQTKLLEHGMSVHHHSTIEGNTVDLYQYEPSLGVKMSRLTTYVADIEQVLGVSGVRVLAPVPNTSFIGFEVPRETRTYPVLPRSKGAFIIQVGQDVQGNPVTFDIRKAPHVLVGGTTGCLAKGTPVLMADMTTKPVEEVVSGDIVLSYDSYKDVSLPNEVGEVIRTSLNPKPMIELTYDKETITTTYDHPFFNGDSFHPLYQLIWGELETSQRVQLELLCKQYGQTFDHTMVRGLLSCSNETSPRRSRVSENSNEWEDGKNAQNSGGELAKEPSKSSCSQSHRRSEGQQHGGELGVVYSQIQCLDSDKERDNKKTDIREERVIGKQERRLVHEKLLSNEHGKSDGHRKGEALCNSAEEISKGGKENYKKTRKWGSIKIKTATPYYAVCMRQAPYTYHIGERGNFITHNSGKSFFITSLITQLFKQPIKEVQAILIDPKGVELDSWEKDKHVIDYVTTPERTVSILQYLVEQMEERYAWLKKHGVKQNSDLADPMPYIFVVIDEYADLVGSKKKVVVGTKEVKKMYKDGMQTDTVNDYETCGVVIAELVQKLAQKARAAGIHIVLATQRPSVAIINGDIKSNFNTKIAFLVAKEIDSRIIIDERGAEKLKGEGDALFSDARGITRVQTYKL